MSTKRSDVEEVIAYERKQLGLDDGEQAMALCLSGGGIRSATFALGVLQGLASLGRLHKFHYLSSVSGGSYIALWLATWIHRSGGDARGVEQALKESITSDQANVPPIRRLRAYSNFLSPVSGLSADAVSVAAICGRNLLLHWMMVLPILFAVLLLPRILQAVLHHDVGSARNIFWIGAALCFLIAIAFASWDASRTPQLRAARHKVPNLIGIAFLFPVVLGAFLVVVAEAGLGDMDFISTLSSIVPFGVLVQIAGEFFGRYALAGDRGARNPRNPFPVPDPVLLLIASAATGAVASTTIVIALYGAQQFAIDAGYRATLAPPFVLGALAFSNVVRSGFSRRWTGEEVREWWGRASGIVGLFALAWLGLSLVVLQVPTWLLRWASTWSGWTAGVAGVGSLLLTIATAAIGFWSRHGSEIKEKTLKFSQTIGLRAMELAAAASVLTIAVSASLLLGWAISLASFVSNSPKENAIPADVACTYFLSTTKDKSVPYCGSIENICGVAGRQMPLSWECKASGAGNGQSGGSGAATHAGTHAANGENVSKSTDTVAAKEVLAPLKDSKEMAYDGLVSTAIAGNIPLDWLARHRLSLSDDAWYWMLAWAVGLLLLAVSASALLGANAFSLNSFYGNRLTRAYLGASRTPGRQRPHPFTGFDKGDNLPLKDIAPAKDDRDGGVRLLPIVNTALNLICPSGDRLEWQQRKAASFFMSPYHCGSPVLKFVRTDSYASIPDGLSVGRAMAISGAAASPSMGYHSSALVSLLMAFFNVRLGWWMPNPKGRSSMLKMEEPRFGIGPVMSEMTSNVGDQSRFVYLSDGGHFENLGLYEMVRRYCGRILVIDAACDPKYQYEDLEDAIRKIRVDLGIRITFDQGLLTPEQARSSGHHWCYGKVHYSELGRGLADGHIVYIKPVLSGDESLDVKRYAESTRSGGRVFPQQPTSDQFFDEAQFESYRELGLHSIVHAFAGQGCEWPEPPGHEHIERGATLCTDARSDQGPSCGAPPVTPERKSGALEALASLGTLGQAALVASITAAITVTGTVALKDPTITLSNPQVTFDPPTIPLVMPKDAAVPVTLSGPVDIGAVAKGVLTFLKSDSDTDTRRELLERMTLLRDELELRMLNNTKKSYPVPPGWDSEVVKGVLEKMNEAARNLNLASSSFKGSGELLDGALKNINDTMSSLSGSASDLNKNLIDVNDNLSRINNVIGQSSPRMTVRGGK